MRVVQLIEEHAPPEKGDPQLSQNRQLNATTIDAFTRLTA
jgi:hypothetical protein